MELLSRTELDTRFRKGFAFPEALMTSRLNRASHGG